MAIHTTLCTPERPGGTNDPASTGTGRDELFPVCSAIIWAGMRLGGGEVFLLASRSRGEPTSHEKGPLSPRFRGEHALRRYPNERGTLHRLQAVRGDLPRAGLTIDAEPREDGSLPHHALTTST